MGEGHGKRGAGTDPRGAQQKGPSVGEGAMPVRKPQPANLQGQSHGTLYWVVLVPRYHTPHLDPNLR